MAMFPPEVVARKMRCFSSPWWAIEREPDVLDEDGELLRPGRAKRFTRLDQDEMYQLATTGQVTIRNVGTVTV